MTFDGRRQLSVFSYRNTIVHAWTGAYHTTFWPPPAAAPAPAPTQPRHGPSLHHPRYPHSYSLSIVPSTPSPGPPLRAAARLLSPSRTRHDTTYPPRPPHEHPQTSQAPQTKPFPPSHAFPSYSCLVRLLVSVRLLPPLLFAISTGRLDSTPIFPFARAQPLNTVSATGISPVSALRPPPAQSLVRRLRDAPDLAPLASNSRSSFRAPFISSNNSAARISADTGLEPVVTSLFGLNAFASSVAPPSPWMRRLERPWDDKPSSLCALRLSFQSLL